MKREGMEVLFHKKGVGINLSLDQFAEKMNHCWQELEEGKKFSRRGEFYCPICKCRKEYFSQIKSNGILGPGGFARISEVICKGCFVKFSPEILECGHKE